MQNDRTEALLLFLGLLGLGIGIAVYLFDRGGNAYFVPDGLGSVLPLRSVFGSLSGSLPAFVHVFAFAVLTAAILGPSRVGAGRICVAWFGVDTSFELAQSATAHALLSNLLPDVPVSIWLLRQGAGYFQHGTFDLIDIYATFAGACIAFLVISATSLQGGRS